MAVLRTNRWRGIRAFALLAGGIAVLVGRPLVLLASVVGVAYAAHASRATQPEIDLAIEREVSDDRPEPGDEVDVTLTVRNEGDRTLGDLRLIDGVPAALPVTEGSPRRGTALRPGTETRLSYTIEARRGEHAFDPVTVLTRDLSGAIEVEHDEPVETTLRVVPRLVATTPLPLRQGTTPFTGRVQTDTGGSGVEFYATREYRHGDALSRIDWKRRARTGELTTLQFREERAATVVLLIDARTTAYRAPEPRAPHAVDRSVDAAGEIFAALLDSGDQVGIAAIGRESLWLPPGTSREHRAKAGELLATHPTLALSPSGDSSYISMQVRWLRRRLPASSQVVFFSPVVDDYAAQLARRLDAYGHATTVVSPDVTGDATPGQRLAAVEREIRLGSLRESGLRVIDWDAEQPLGVAIERAAARWSR